MTSRSTWKAAERQIAKLFGTERTPLSGSNSKHTSSDTLHDMLYIEVKYRKNHTSVALWNDTKHKSQREGKVPVVALKTKGSKFTHLVFEVNDFIKIAQELMKCRE